MDRLGIVAQCVLRRPVVHTGAAVVSTWCLVQPLLCLAAFSGHAQILLKPVHRVHGGQVLEGFVSRPTGCTAGQAKNEKHVPGTYLRKARVRISQITFGTQPGRMSARLPVVWALFQLSVSFDDRRPHAETRPQPAPW